NDNTVTTDRWRAVRFKNARAVVREGMIVGRSGNRKSSCVVTSVRRWPVSSMDNLSVFFLAEGEQSAHEVMARLTTFIRAAKQTLAFAIYDMRFSDPLRVQLATALRDRADAGVEIRFCYDADKPPEPNLAAGQDPAPAG